MAHGRSTTVTSVRLVDNLYDSVNTIAKSRGTSMSAALSFIISDWLQIQSTHQEASNQETVRLEGALLSQLRTIASRIDHPLTDVVTSCLVRGIATFMRPQTPVRRPLTDLDIHAKRA